MHNLLFNIHNHDVAQKLRSVQCNLSNEDIAQFIDKGFLRLKHRLSLEYCEHLKHRTMHLVSQKCGGAPQNTYRSNRFAGQYLRQPHELDLAFLEILRSPYPYVDIARSLIGPRILIRSFSVRITYPFSGDGTAWHSDQRSFVTPRPPLFTEPHVVTLGIYLDGADEGKGLFHVMPGSHRWDRQPNEADQFECFPGQESLSFAPGEAVLFDAAIWHRGGENLSNALRRMIIIHFAPVFCKPAIYETPQPSAEFSEFVSQLRADEDEPMLELLGFNGLKSYQGFM